MKAFLKNHRQAPRKLRVIANGVRGKNVAVALAELGAMPQKGSTTLQKLIASAFANAKQDLPNVKEQDLFVKTITVDKGITYVRFMPRAMGRATPINRECSHVRVELAEKVEESIKAPTTIADTEKANNMSVKKSRATSTAKKTVATKKKN